MAADRLLHVGPRVRWPTYASQRAAAALALGVSAMALWFQIGGVVGSDPRDVAPLALRAGLVSLVLAATAFAVSALVFPPLRPSSDGAAWPPPLLLALGVLLIVGLSLEAPWRLVANLLGFVCVGAPLVLVVFVRAGPVAATDAALAFCLFALVPAARSMDRPPGTLDFEPASPYRWSVGFPTTEWRLSHEVRLDEPPGDTPLELLVWLAREHTGDAELHAWLNGVALGPLRPEEFNSRVVAIPRELSADQTTLRFELSATTVDPSLRLLAHPWAGGATAGMDASQYFDGRRWWPGTFNDLVRQPQAGIYVMSVRGLWW